ncbi:hypothetical protein KAR91_21215 [Candidatus Pacearchaeota archaeon]|nr:hypothetical protein [Candidatus Pacearchaeota archaeon]
MKKADIWKAVGDLFSTPFEDRTEQHKEWTSKGVCYAFHGLDLSFRLIEESVLVDRDNKFYPYMLPTRYYHGHYACDELANADKFRAKYCYERMNDELG